MALTRSQLVNGLISLDAELLRLEMNDEPQESFQLMFERMVATSMAAVAPRDRLWWWGQVYWAMDQQAVRAAGFPGRDRDGES